MRNRRPLFIIFLIIFVNLLGFGVIIPLLPFYADHVGATPFQIGLLFASYSICQLLATPILGNLSDRYGRRPILLLSLLGTVVSFVLLAIANSLWLLFASRIIDGLSGGNISTARAYISDVTEKEERAQAFGLIGAAFGLGFIFGPALGGLLGKLSYSAPAWAAAGLAFVALVLTWVGLPESHHRVKVATPSLRRDLPRLLRRPTLGTLLLVNLLLWTSLAVYETTFALFGKYRFGFGITEVGYILAVAGLIGAIIQGGLVGLFTRRFGEQPVLAGGLMLASLGLGVASLVHTVLIFVVAIIVASVGAALAHPTLIALISHTADPQEQGSVHGISSALGSLGRTVGPVWGNSFLEFFGEGVAFFSAAAVLFGLFLIAARLINQQTLSGRQEVISGVE